MQRRIELRDPRALRALAHPIRIRLLGRLRREGPLTASEAGRRIGESSGSASYHLRQLARYGLVEEAPSEGGRERPWRATALSTSWPNVADTEELAEAAQAFERFVLARYLARLEWWLDRRRTEPVEWQEAASYGDTLLYLTVDELASLRDALQALAEPYLDRLTDPAARPEDARLVRLLQIAFPDDEA
ncbi:MAG TPA: helix-turn-helix domain-containing protein [Gaiella sp.]|nr:helix-turn-helix domain-containing protein [Gaiella sp.]